MKRSSQPRRISRRRFVGTALIAGSSMAALPLIFVPKAHASWAKRTRVHPNVENLRVVGITDPKMTTAHRSAASWSRQDGLVDTEVVWVNMDKLACRLTGERNPDEAWRAIFLKPPGKSWRDTIAAIKTNHISRQHTRSAVMAKICRTLVYTIGLRPGNIHIYDAIHGATMVKDTPFRGLPQGCRIENDWGGITARVRVPGPWKGGRATSKCLKHLVDGSVDILVDIAMCKGHAERFGGFTMTMKNHLGTFSPRPAHRSGSTDYLMAIHQTPEILGPMDKKTGRVLHPRQQLCLVDALWASKRGPRGKPSHQTNFLAMGVFAPAVDYLVATRFRGDRMGWKPQMGPTRRMLTDFGYTEADLPDGGNILDVS